MYKHRRSIFKFYFRKNLRFLRCVPKYQKVADIYNRDVVPFFVLETEFLNII